MQINLSDAVENYLLACRAEGKSQKTLRAYHDILYDFVPAVGDIPVPDLTPQTIQAYIADLYKRPGRKNRAFSTHSAAKYYAVVRSFIRWVFAQGWLEKRITDFTKAPRLSDDLPDCLTDEEIARLLNYCRERGKLRDTVIIAFFLDTGVRLEELVSLDLNDVHIEGGWVKVYGKGRREGIVPIGHQLARDLHLYIKTERKAAPGETALFINRFGQRLEYDGVGTLVQRILKAIRLDGKCGPHTLRHTFATRYLRNGGNLESLRKILRHRSIAVTQRYVHFLQQDVLDDHLRASPYDNLSQHTSQRQSRRAMRPVR